MTNSINVVYEGERPNPLSIYDLEQAPSDPLTPVALLRELYREKHSFVDQYLVQNPSLPLDIFEEIAEKNSGIQLLTSPHLKEEHFLRIVENTFDTEKEFGVVNASKIKNMRAIEFFDLLVTFRLPTIVNTIFLCHALVSDEDFYDRVNRHRKKLDDRVLFEHSRFDVNALVQPWLKSWSEMDTICANVSASSETLRDIVNAVLNRGEEPPTRAYENFNCPIEVSASYYVNRLKNYKWSPSLLLVLEAKADEYLLRTVGEEPWGDLPLRWKLKMIAE